MFQPPRMVSYQVRDLQKAKEWYSAVLGHGPGFDSPMACVFPVGECSLSLLPQPTSSEGTAGGVAFWHVDDIDSAYRRLIDAGAVSVTEITLLMLRSRIARVRDPFGNVIRPCDERVQRHHPLVAERARSLLEKVGPAVGR